MSVWLLCLVLSVYCDAQKNCCLFVIDVGMWGRGIQNTLSLCMFRNHCPCVLALLFLHLHTGQCMVAPLGACAMTLFSMLGRWGGGQMNIISHSVYHRQSQDNIIAGPATIQFFLGGRNTKRTRCTLQRYHDNRALQLL